MQRRTLTQALLWAACAPSLARAQSSKPIRLVVPFPPGGASDITARIVGEALAKESGQPVVIDNKAGAGGTIGTADVARAPADGLTIGLATLSTHGVNPAIYKKLPYDVEKNFVPVAELVKAPGVLLVSERLGVTDFASFRKLLQAQPGKLTYASPGNGSIGHMWGELFKSATQTFMLHIPYSGAAPAMNALVAGQVDVAFDQVAPALPQIKAQKLRALAVSWPQRLTVLPEVPTYAQLGLAGNNAPSWFGLVAPAGTPDDVVQRLHAAVVRALKAPGVSEKLAAQALFVSTLESPQQFGAQIRDDVQRMRKVALSAKVELE
jgi:tripartite-type tricarboxylate transporter receptor subunit TctC